MYFLSRAVKIKHRTRRITAIKATLQVLRHYFAFNEATARDPRTTGVFTMFSSHGHLA